MAGMGFTPSAQLLELTASCTERQAREGRLAPTLSRLGTESSEMWCIYSVGRGDAAHLAKVAEEAEEDELPKVPCCSHKPYEFVLDRHLECSDCRKIQQPGDIAFRCDGCSEVQCDSCHWMDQMDMTFYVPSETSTCSSSTCGDFDEEIGMDTAESLGSSSSSSSSSNSGCCDQAAPTVKSVSASSRSCHTCRMPYKGFGTTCGSCRVNPLGTIRACDFCGYHFKGFGPTCGDCCAGVVGAIMDAQVTEHRRTRKSTWCQFRGRAGSEATRG